MGNFLGTKLELTLGSALGVNFASSNTIANILGSNLIEIWDAALGYALVGGNVDTWTGQIRGTVAQAISAAQRPIFSASDAGFGGQPSVTTNTATPRGMRGTAAATLIASGTRPYLFVVGKQNALPTDVAQHRIVGNGVDAVSDRADLYSPGTVVTSDLAYIANSNVGTRAITITPDTSKHLFEGWSTAANTILDYDGTTVATGVAATVGGITNAIGIGCAASGAYHFSDFTFVTWGICTAVPSATVRSQFRVYCQTRWGTP